MTTIKTLTPQEVLELEELQKEYPVATLRAAEALRTRGLPLEGIALQRFLDEDAKVAAIVRKMKELVGLPV